MQINQSVDQSKSNIDVLSMVAALAYAEEIFKPLIDARCAYYAKKEKEAIEEKILGSKDDRDKEKLINLLRDTGAKS